MTGNRREPAGATNLLSRIQADIRDRDKWDATVRAEINELMANPIECMAEYKRKQGERIEG